MQAMRVWSSPSACSMVARVVSPFADSMEMTVCFPSKLIQSPQAALSWVAGSFCFLRAATTSRMVAGGSVSGM